MAERKSPVDQMLDLCLYGPLGLLVTARMKYPQMVAEGRKQLASHAKVGRFVAQTATSRGKQEAEKAMSRLRDNGQPTASAPSAAPADAAEAAEAEAEAETAAEPEVHSIAEEEVIPVRHDDDDPTTAGSVAADELAIPGYDSLAASQVVQRLDGLTDRELEAVRRYEVAHRARKTVLGKVAQLQRRP
jgi:hypothetical protein